MKKEKMIKTQGLQSHRVVWWRQLKLLLLNHRKIKLTRQVLLLEVMTN